MALHRRALKLMQPGPLLCLTVPILNVVLVVWLTLPVAPRGVKGHVGLLALQVEPSEVTERLPRRWEVRGHLFSAGSQWTDSHEGLNPGSLQSTQTADRVLGTHGKGERVR